MGPQQDVIVIKGGAHGRPGRETATQYSINMRWRLGPMPADGLLVRDLSVRAPSLLQRGAGVAGNRDQSRRENNLKLTALVWPDFGMGCKARSLFVHQHAKIVSELTLLWICCKTDSSCWLGAIS